MGTQNFFNHVKTDGIYKDIGLGAKTYSYLKDSNDADKIAKDTKKCVIKRKLKFQDLQIYNCLEAAQTERKINYLRKKLISIILKKIKQNS